jgi:uridine kinase
VRKPKQPLLVAIVGGSGSGKTWLADKFQAVFGSEAGRLSLDDFYRDRSHLSRERRARINFDNPAAVDWRQFEHVLNCCLRWEKAEVPRYDFKTHCRLRAGILKPKPIMLVEGLWLLRSARIRRIFAFSIFLEVSIRLRLRRRLGRDVSGRGRSRKSVHEQFWKTVEPMYRKFVRPQIRLADLVHQGDWKNQDVAKLAALLRQKTYRDQSPP